MFNRVLMLGMHQNCSEKNHAKRVISYAASFGNTTIEKLGQYAIDKEVSKWLKKFDALSVRDKNSEEIVFNLTGKTPESHLDPVLIYDYMAKCERIPEKIKEPNYLVLYGYSGRFSEEECRCIRKYAQKHRLKILCIGGIQERCDQFIDCSPFEVFAYFNQAHAVITDIFHCGKCLQHFLVDFCVKRNSKPLNNIRIKNRNKDRVFTSVSGGASDVLARHIITDNGVAFGCVYSNDLEVEHIEILHRK